MLLPTGYPHSTSYSIQVNKRRATLLFPVALSSTSERPFLCCDPRSPPSGKGEWWQAIHPCSAWTRGRRESSLGPLASGQQTPELGSQPPPTSSPNTPGHCTTLNPAPLPTHGHAHRFCLLGEPLGDPLAGDPLGDPFPWEPLLSPLNMMK